MLVSACLLANTNYACYIYNRTFSYPFKRDADLPLVAAVEEGVRFLVWLVSVRAQVKLWCWPISVQDTTKGALGVRACFPRDIRRVFES